jgi:predicted polyphosphate/ATP-dependent NAD kinase
MPTNDPEKQRRYWREHYARNPQRHRERNDAQKRAARELVQRIKSETPCTDCGMTAIPKGFVQARYGTFHAMVEANTVADIRRELRGRLELPDTAVATRETGLVWEAMDEDTFVASGSTVHFTQIGRGSPTAGGDPPKPGTVSVRI